TETKRVNVESRKTLADSCREDFRMRIGPRGDNEEKFLCSSLICTGVNSATVNDKELYQYNYSIIEGDPLRENFIDVTECNYTHYVIMLRHKVPRFKAPLIALSSIKSASFTRNFSQPATQGKEEEEEIEIDQRRVPTDYEPATFDPTEHRRPPTDRVWRLVDEMSSLTLAEVAELSSIMMKKMGMEPPVIVVMKGGVTKEDAEQIIEKMKAVGAKAVMQ
ncbi:50S ribosomal protein L7/L12, partial [Tanacetum coccineum]